MGIVGPDLPSMRFESVPEGSCGPYASSSSMSSSSFPPSDSVEGKRVFDPCRGLAAFSRCSSRGEMLLEPDARRIRSGDVLPTGPPEPVLLRAFSRVSGSYHPSASSPRFLNNVSATIRFLKKDAEMNNGRNEHG